MNGIGTVSFSLHLLLALLMGGTVGLERQWRQRLTGTAPMPWSSPVLQLASRCAGFANGRIEYEGFARTRLVE
jgi:hypothetical protein